MPTITFARDGGSYDVNMADFPAHILEQLAIHGLQQKVADSCADKAKAGNAAQIRDRSISVITMLLGGTWANKAGGAKIRTEDQYVNAMAKRAAEDRRKTDAKAAALPLEKVIAAYAAAKGEAWREEYRARQAAKAADIDLDME